MESGYQENRNIARKENSLIIFNLTELFSAKERLKFIQKIYPRYSKKEWIRVFERNIYLSFISRFLYQSKIVYSNDHI